MSIVNYPAVFHQEDGGYWVEFPDLEGCFTQGDSLEETFQSAQEALGIYLDTADDSYPRTFQEPSTFESIKKAYPDETIMFVPYDSLEYAKKYKNKAVKKTLTIPEWLNEAATKKNINFSQTLQEALISKL